MTLYYDEFLTQYVLERLCEMTDEISAALKHMDHYRCPLSSASEKIVCAIDDAVRDYCVDHDYDYYNFDVEAAFDRDIETIFFDVLGYMED